MRFWTSDIHFGHENIIKYCDRPFDNAETMNERIVRLWNETVAPSDTVMVLGDVAMGKIKDTLPLVEQLNGDKFLVPGNHDRVWKGHKKWHKAIKQYEDVGFDILPEQMHVKLAGKDVVVCHFPYDGDSHGEDRYVEFRPRNRNDPLLHGHVHDAWDIKGLQYNVGMDVHGFKPIAETEIIAWLETL